MQKSLVLGANGKVAQQLGKRLPADGLPVRAMLLQKEQHRTFTGLDIDTITAAPEADLSSAFDSYHPIILSCSS